MTLVNNNPLLHKFASLSDPFYRNLYGSGGPPVCDSVGVFHRNEVYKNEKSTRDSSFFYNKQTACRNATDSLFYRID